MPLIDGGTLRLPRLIGHSRALDLILTGRPVGAAEALAMGLANRVVADGTARAAAEALAAELAQTTLRTARVPVIQNVTATPETAPEALRANLAAQVTGSVRWADTVRRLSAEGVQRVVEIGPGAVLSGLIKRIAPEILVYNVSDTATAAGLVAWLDSEVGS